ncbi:MULTISPECIES: hypothetical protein [Rhizobium]|uniref:hypothetical protein n=1 Tax=Rhizobium TaxID=379 RepID=UPI0015CF015B|nr:MULTISPECIES: hypothetical protein [Rhizobium]ULJ82657.1 hypothetical protein MF410_33795 [Rhizobium sp. C104]
MKWWAPGKTLLFREEWAHRAQGKKVLEGRCGRTIEAKPVFDQTCLIEPTKDVAWLRAKGIWRWQLRPDCLPGPCNGGAAALPHVKIRRPGTAEQGRCVGRSSGYRRVRESSPGGPMRQQPKPFTVEIKPSRKLKPIDRKTSIWGKLDLTADPDTLSALRPEQVPAAGETNDRR